jgi:hypothetical protein
MGASTIQENTNVYQATWLACSQIQQHGSPAVEYRLRAEVQRSQIELMYSEVQALETQILYGREAKKIPASLDN